MALPPPGVFFAPRNVKQKGVGYAESEEVYSVDTPGVNAVVGQESQDL
jgi:hypothetical protein